MTVSQAGLREEAKASPYAKSAASNWNHTWQPVLDVFLTTQVSDRSHCAGHGGRSLVCLFWTGFQGLHYPQGLGQPHGPRHLWPQVSADALETTPKHQLDSRPQAILKHQPPNSLDYSTRYGCQPDKNCFMFLIPLWFKNQWFRFWIRKKNNFHTRFYNIFEINLITLERVAKR